MRLRGMPAGGSRGQVVGCGDLTWLASKGRDKLAATGAPVRPPAEPRMPGAPGSRPANPWLRPNPLCRVQQPAPSPVTDLHAITEAVSTSDGRGDSDGQLERAAGASPGTGDFFR